MFRLDPQLANDTIEVAKLDLCFAGLMKDRRFPWLILVPQRADCVEIGDLESQDRLSLMEEVVLASRALQSSVPDTYKVNVAALGNMVRQLHVHVIARRQDDAAWPNPVWGIGKPEPYNSDEAQALIASLRQYLA